MSGDRDPLAARAIHELERAVARNRELEALLDQVFASAFELRRAADVALKGWEDCRAGSDRAMDVLTTVARDVSAVGAKIGELNAARTAAARKARRAPGDRHRQRVRELYHSTPEMSARVVGVAIASEEGRVDEDGRVMPYSERYVRKLLAGSKVSVAD
jgi:hypothetical protein